MNRRVAGLVARFGQIVAAISLIVELAAATSEL